MLSSQVRVYGGIVREGNPEEYFLEVIEKRNKETLINVFSRRLMPGSTISSDSWKGYGRIDQELPGYILKSTKS